MKKIITISREFGSGGRYIGKMLAEELGCAFYDKDIIAQTADQTGLSAKYIEERGEYAPKSNIFSYAFGRNASGTSVNDIIYQAQQKIILDIAEKESCVIVGRCADYILRDREDVLNVFIYGEAPEKCKRIMELYHLTEKEAMVRMKDIDKKRGLNYTFYTDHIWGETRNYALCINSSVVGYNTCVKLIREAI
jgi:cytidylate kinase